MIMQIIAEGTVAAGVKAILNSSVCLTTITYTCFKTCRDIFEPLNIKILRAQLTEVFTVPTPTAAMRRCYLDLRLFAGDEYVQSGWMIHRPSV